MVVLAANGPAFSAGHDMKEMTARRSDADRGRAYFKQLMDTCSAMMQAIVHLPKPVIARGARHRDRGRLPAGRKLRPRGRLERAQVRDPRRQYRPVLLDPDGRAVAQRRAQARDGDAAHRRPDSADDARRIGLVNRVVAPGAARDEALKLARKIAAKSAAVVKIGKEAFYRQLEMDVVDAYGYASEVMVKNMLARDAEEGIGAFIEKRTPSWEDR